MSDRLKFYVVTLVFVWVMTATILIHVRNIEKIHHQCPPAKAARS